MTDQANDNGQVEDAEIREATPGDYLVTRDEDDNIQPVEVIHQSKRHVVKPFTYGEASRYYGDGEGVQDMDDEQALEIIKEKFVTPDLSALNSADDLKPSSVVKLLSVIHKASEINADIQREDGLNRVDFAEDEKKTG
jgi:hypothetical protein